MRIAQRLYEEGYITYMRTDSVNLSQEAINSAKDFIEKNLGRLILRQEIIPRNLHQHKEAHEAIRPTDFSVKSIDDVQLNKLYQLIYKRTLASQMANAKLKKPSLKSEILLCQVILKLKVK